MNDQSGTPEIGHNNPPEPITRPVLPGEATPEQIARAQEAAKAPEAIEGKQAYDPATHAELSAHVAVFCDAAGKWLDIKTVQNAEQAERLTDFVTGARGLFKRVEDSRKAAKKPWDDLGTQVQSAYTPLTAKVEKIAKSMKAMQADWLKRENDRIAEEKRQAEIKAAEARAEAERLAAIAEANNDIAGQVEAEEALKAAQKAEKAAAKPAKAQAGSATGAGRTMSLRTVKTAEIVNARACFAYFQNDPAVVDVLQRLANAAVRSGDLNEDQAIMAGIKIKTAKV